MKRFTLKASLVGVMVSAVSAVPVAMAADGVSFFNACVSDPPQSAGLYRLSASGYQPEQLKRNIYASGGGVADDNYYYGVRYEVIGGIPVVECTSYSLKTWNVEDSYTNCKISNVATDLAYFAPRDEAYGCYFNESGTGYVFGKSKLSQFSYEPVADLEVAFAAMDFDADGVLYAIDWMGKLNIVDTADGSLTYVGDTGLQAGMIVGGVIDRQAGVFYYSVKTDSESAIYAVDLATAGAVKMYDLENDEQVGGMYFPVTYESGAPAASGNPSVNIAGTDLSGTVRFRAPQKSVGGDLLTSPVTYHIEANGKEVARGTAEYADGFISVDVALDAPGRYCFSLYFSNEDGRGPRSKVTQYVGPDTPKAPVSPRMTYKGGTVKLFWTAGGSTGVNGGSIDRSDMYYKITRMPDGEVYQAESSGWSQTIDEPAVRTTYCYEIRTVAGGLESQPAFTPEFALGPIVPPYADGFATQNSTIGWSWLNNDSYVDDNYTSSGMRLVSMNAPEEGAYLVSPAMNLVAGNKYEVSVALKRGNSNYAETVEVVAGDAPTAEALRQITIIPSTGLDGDDYTTFTGTIEPAATGTYHIALHATSEAGRMVYMRSFAIGKGVCEGAPGAVTDLSAVAAADGSHSVTVSFTAPEVTLEGAELTELTSAELLRDDVSVKTITEGVVPGASLEITDDTEPAAGQHVYTVICHNSAGNGVPVSAQVWVGFNAPEPVEWVKVKETETLGTVEVTWEEAKADIDGKPLDNAKVTYNVYDRAYNLVKSGLEETSLVLRAQEPQAPMDWAQYRVSAVTEGGESDLTKSILVPVGPADKAPYRESWPGKEGTHIIGTTANSVGDTWMVVGGFSYNGREVDPQDGDGGMMGLENTVPDEIISLYTGKIDLSEVSAPAMSFWVYNYIGDNGKDNANELEVKILGDDDEDFGHLQSIIVGETGPKREWNKVTVPLTGYDGQTVRLRIEAKVVTAIYVHLDNIEVTTSSPCNLAASGITAPVSVNPGEEFAIGVAIHNNGDTDIDGAEVRLLRDGQVAATRRLGLLKSGDRMDVSFGETLTVLSPDVVTYVCEVVADGDLVEADNMTDEATVALRRTGVPPVTDLAGKAGEEGISLNWSAPELSDAAPSPRVEGFEGATPWKSQVEGWSFLDLDRATIGGIGKKQLPVSGQQSFFVIDDTYKELNYTNDGDRFKAHDGKQCLWSMYSMRGNTYVQSDDWAISPELYGGPQTVSLWASSFKADAGQPQYLESFEVLASQEGTETADFVKVARVDNVPAQWTRYEFYLPAGTRRMAIRGVSYDKYLLMVDDVEFIAAGDTPRSLVLTGYNIYRDGVCLTSVPAAQTTYTDRDVATSDTYRYRVTALYGGDGESEGSNEVEVASLGSLASPSASQMISVTAGEGLIMVKGAGARRIVVTGADGRVVAVGEGRDEASFAVTPGVYLVTVGSATVKVLCR